VTPEDLLVMPKIDAHTHLVGNGLDDEALVPVLERHAMRWISICWLESEESFARQAVAARRFSSAHPDRFSWITTFPLDGFSHASWTGRAVAAVDDGLAAGAIGVKVWKNVGMELKDADGRYVMIDDTRFDPVLERVRALGMTLTAHIGEPRNAWLQLDEMTVAADRSYFAANPGYHGLKRPDMPCYREQVASRDRMLERHTGLRVVGCHLGSLEYDVREVADRLDRFPSFAVDLSGRVCHLQVQQSGVVREFLVKYQDRILYGTDMGWRGGAATAPERAAHLRRMDTRYLADYRYFAGSGVVDAPDVGPGARCEALALPDGVLEKIFRANALAWYPLIDARSA
jgi:predicted TIM-barrel fold metal-dependent hydrolase